MDVIVKLSVPNYVYRFYADASVHVFGCTAEALMADALAAYAGLLSDTMMKERAVRLQQMGEEVAAGTEESEELGVRMG